MVNTHKKALIGDLSKSETKLWNRIANDLDRSARSQRQVNVSKLARCSKEGDVIVVPGKVLGSGAINHKVTVAAYAFSSGAKAQIEAAKGKCMTLEEMFKQNPKGEKVRILG